MAVEMLDPEIVFDTIQLNKLNNLVLFTALELTFQLELELPLTISKKIQTSL